MAPRKRKAPEPPTGDRRVTRSMSSKSAPPKTKKRKIETGQGSEPARTAAATETGHASEPVTTAAVGTETGQGSEPGKTAAVATEPGDASEPEKAASVTETGDGSESEKTAAVVTEPGDSSEPEKIASVTETGDVSEPEKTADVVTETGDGSEPEKTADVTKAGDVSEPAPEEKGKTTVQETVEVEGATSGSGSGSGSGSKGPIIIVEHCKIGRKIKMRAVELQKALLEADPDITVVLNPEQPRRECFEVRMEGGETFISLLDLKRPFTALTELNMEEVAAGIIAKIKA